MPTTYAHWRFGQECIETLPDNLKKIVNNNLDIFNIGVHGPDILFYCLPNKKIVDHGYKMHHIPANMIFENAKRALEKCEDKDAMLSYILGFLTHFTLDSSLHSYVERKREVAEITHNYVESEYDAHLMRLDNRKVNLVDRTESLNFNKQTGKVLSCFYPFTPKEIVKALRWQTALLRIMNCITDGKRKRLKTMLRIIKHNKYADLILEVNEDERCKDSNLRLDKLRNKALKLYPKLLDDLLAYFDSNKKLSKYFDHDFDEWPDYKEIPVLSYEEEINYKV